MSEVNALNPAAVNATAQEAAAIQSRAPSAEEIAATDAIQNEALDRAVSLEDYTTRVVVVAIGAHDRATFNGVSAVALRLAMRQAKVTAGNGLYSPEADDFILNSIYLDAALSGKQIFRNSKDSTDSQDKVAEIVAETDMAKKRALAVDYVMKFGKGKKLVKGIALLRQDGMRLATYMREHAGEVINTCASLAGEHRAVAKLWRSAVMNRMGDTYAKLSDKLETLYGNPNKGKGGKGKKSDTPAPAETAETPAPAETVNAGSFATSNDATDADKIAAIFDIVETLSAEGFAALVARVNEEAAARANATVTDAEFSEVSEETAETAETGAPLMLAAPIVAETVKRNRGGRRRAA